MISTLKSSANGKSPKESPPSHLDFCWMLNDEWKPSMFTRSLVGQNWLKSENLKLLYYKEKNHGTIFHLVDINETKSKQIFDKHLDNMVHLKSTPHQRSRFMLYLLQNMTFKNSNSTTQTYRNHKQNTQIPRATCVEFDLPSEWQTWLPRWGFVTLGVSSLECHKVRILDESIYLWGYPSLSRVSVLSSEHQSICQIHLPFFSDSADQWSSRKSNKLKPEPAGLGRGVS